MKTPSSSQPYFATPKAPTTSLSINLKAIQHNWIRLNQLSQKTCQTGAVIKANGYGMGMEAVSLALHQAGCRHFYTARIDEAHQLKECFDKAVIHDSEIIVFDGILEGHERYFDHPSLIAVLNDKEQIGRAQKRATQHSHKIPCHIHVDTGMSRLGLPLDKWQDLKSSDELDGLDIQMVMSHLASADMPNSEQNRQQLSRFKAALDSTEYKASFANSGGIFLGDDYHFHQTRPGLALYGLTPDESQQNLEMAIHWQADILQIRDLKKGMTVGYGASFVADKDMKVATIGVGYADGFLRRSQKSINLRIAGTDCPLIGRVSMDSCVVDISALPSQQVEEAKQAIIIDSAMSAYELADKTDTIIYEIMTMLGERVLRLYDGDDETNTD